MSNISAYTAKETLLGKDKEPLLPLEEFHLALGIFRNAC